MELAPSAEKILLIFFHQASDFRQFMVGEAKVFRQQDWVELELRFEVIAGDVDVRRFHGFT